MNKDATRRWFIGMPEVPFPNAFRKMTTNCVVASTRNTFIKKLNYVHFSFYMENQQEFSPLLVCN